MTIIILNAFWHIIAAPAPAGLVIVAPEEIRPYEALFQATCKVESDFNPFAYNATDQKGGSWGIVQIGQSMLSAFNAENGTNYVLSDCFDVSVSKQVFMWHFQKQHPDIEAASRSYNGGVNWRKKKSTEKYYQKILKSL